MCSVDTSADILEAQRPHHVWVLVKSVQGYGRTVTGTEIPALASFSLVSCSLQYPTHRWHEVSSLFYAVAFPFILNFI